MNTALLLSNLEEAETEVRRLIERLQMPDEIPFEDFHVAIAHLYRHLNSAWNSRHVTREEWSRCSAKDFEKWGRFPSDLPLIGDESFFDLPEYREEAGE